MRGSAHSATAMLALLSSAPAMQLQLRRAIVAPSSRRLLSVVAQEGGGRASAAVVQAKKTADQDDSPARQGAMDLNPPRGTRDFYPEDMALRTWLFGKWRETAAAHGFEEYDAPVLETEDLYIRKAGEDVTQQLYSLEDRSGRRLALRPEMTPSLARMVLGRKSALPMPVKVRGPAALRPRPTLRARARAPRLTVCCGAPAVCSCSGSRSRSAGATSG